MKIAILINELNIRGGTHKQVLKLCQYLRDKGDEITIYTRKYEPEKTYPEFADFELVSIGDASFSSNKLVKKIQTALMMDSQVDKLLQMVDKDTDIINVHDMGFQRYMYMIKKKSKAVVVWQINDLPTCFRVGFAKNVKDSITLRLQRIFERIYARKIDAITVNVSKNKEHVIKNYRKEAKVFYCGVDLNANLKKHSFKKEISLNLLTMGVFYPHRNYEVLVRVVKKLVEQGVSVHLNIIGSTENDPIYAKKIINQIQKSGMEDYITICGQVDEAKYNQLFDEADIFLFLNINQSWGLAVFEAMSCGLPTIVSDSVGAIELLHNEKDSIVLNPENVDEICDVIIKLGNDKEFYNAISMKAIEATNNYTWDLLYSSKMRELFCDLIN